MATTNQAFHRAIRAALMAGAMAALAAAPAAAQTSANPCAGLDESKCRAMAACSWLPGYKVPNGKDVAGYCRTAPQSLSLRRARPKAEQAPATTPGAGAQPPAGAAPAPPPKP